MQAVVDMQNPITQSPVSRLYFIDNLRILLAVLVIMHHAGQPYGPGGGWWIPAEPPQFIDTLVLGAFFGVNMSFFMGLFFMISSYFIPSSVERKGAKIFYKDRVIRLGIPLIIFSMLIFPIMLYLLHGIGVTSFKDYYLHTYLTIAGLMKGQGFTFWHLWFLEQLLIFSGFYLLYCKVTGVKQRSVNRIAFPGNVTLAIFTVVLGLAMFLIRIVFPLNLWLPYISFEPAHYPEYILLFIVGILAFKNDWFNTLPMTTAKKWNTITYVTIIALFPMFLIFRDSLAEGGLTLPNFFLSFWEAILCVGMCISLVALFRSRYNFQGKVAKALSDNTFTVYLIHVPIIVFLQYMLIGVNIHPLIKFAIVCLIGVPACFITSHYLVRRLPLAKHIL